EYEGSSTDNYGALPVLLRPAERSCVTETHRRHYRAFPGGFCELDVGHRHPARVATAPPRLDRDTLTSRAFHQDQFGACYRDLAELTGADRVLPMNSGVEAVESAIKLARKWAHRVRGVPQDTAEIIVAGGNFHGRTTTVVSFSSDTDARADYGPFTPGFVS